MDTSAASFFLLMVFYMNYYHQERDKPTVNIPELGQATGSIMRSTSGRKFQAFRGIPYAEPPVESLRFRVKYRPFIVITIKLYNINTVNLFKQLQDPVPLKSWGDKPLDATKEGPMCMQLDFNTDAIKGQEDCLILNVYTPSVRHYKIAEKWQN